MLLIYRDDTPALIDAATGSIITYAELYQEVQKRAKSYFPQRGLVFIFTENTVDSIITYLAALYARCPVALLDKQLKKDFSQNLIKIYQPEYITFCSDLDLSAEYNVSSSGFFYRKVKGKVCDLHEDLAILLSTSGSTGSPKFVRLSKSNILSNTSSIIESLNINRSERAITMLQFHYSYGMSVLNTHLQKGASIVVTNTTIMESEFWEFMKKYEVTSLAGVPYTYQVLDRLDFHNMDLPKLRNLTQAGGKMASNLTKKIWQIHQSKNRKLYIMYGQTEAAPRISCASAEDLGEKIGSAGKVLTGGKIWIRTDNNTLTDEANITGEIVYEGPNVMMGYASNRSDLALEDTQGDILHTGDLGYLDEDGFLFLTGRSKRIAKIFGLRLNLDEVEDLLKALGTVAAIGVKDKLHVYHESTNEILLTTSRKELATSLKIPFQAIQMHYIEGLPTMASGKINYRELAELHER